MDPDVTLPPPNIHPHRTLLGAVAVLLVLILAAVGLTYFFYTQNSKEHLIQGVPYWGIYSGSMLITSTQTSVYSTLKYWGDDRFSREDIITLFPAEKVSEQNLNSLSEFFDENGYQTELTNIIDVNKLKKKLKEALANDTPVIVVQKLSPAMQPSSNTMRILIGYSDKEKTFVSSDYDFGNNYLISYTDFAALNIDSPSTALIVAPSESLQTSLGGPDVNSAYPPRLSIMDSPEIHNIRTKLGSISALGSIYAKTGKVTSPEIVALYEDIIASEGFNKLSPFSRMLTSYRLARFYNKWLEEPEKAVDVLTKITIPLLQDDFSKPFGEWEVSDPEFYKQPWMYSKPWELLGFAYLGIGDEKKAKEAFEKALVADPTASEASGELKKL